MKGYTKLLWLPVIVLAAMLAGCGNTAEVAAPTMNAWEAAATGNVEVLRAHAAAGTDLDAKEPAGGGTPLHIAAMAGQPASVDALVAAGADLEARNNQNGTPLHVAAFFAHADAARALLDAGAKLDAQNQDDATALDVATVPWTPEWEGLYTYLAEALQIDIDLERIKAERVEVADILRGAGQS